jgi:hypothetical protein
MEFKNGLREILRNWVQDRILERGERFVPGP